MRATVYEAKKALAQAYMQRGLMSEAVFSHRKAWIDANHVEGHVELPDEWLIEQPSAEEQAEAGQTRPHTVTQAAPWTVPAFPSGTVHNVAWAVVWLGIISGVFLIVRGFFGIEVPTTVYSEFLSPRYERVVLWWMIGTGLGTLWTTAVWFVLLRGLATLLARGES